MLLAVDMPGKKPFGMVKHHHQPVDNAKTGASYRVSSILIAVRFLDTSRILVFRAQRQDIIQRLEPPDVRETGKGVAGKGVTGKGVRP